jgi:hypothetical protein
MFGKESALYRASHSRQHAAKDHRPRAKNWRAMSFIARPWYMEELELRSFENVANTSEMTGAQPLSSSSLSCRVDTFC